LSKKPTNIWMNFFNNKIVACSIHAV
jgi:hypothetical protein